MDKAEKSEQRNYPDNKNKILAGPLVVLGLFVNQEKRKTDEKEIHRALRRHSDGQAVRTQRIAKYQIVNSEIQVKEIFNESEQAKQGDEQGKGVAYEVDSFLGAVLLQKPQRNAD